MDYNTLNITKFFIFFQSNLNSNLWINKYIQILCELSSILCKYLKWHFGVVSRFYQNYLSHYIKCGVSTFFLFFSWVLFCLNQRTICCRRRVNLDNRNFQIRLINKFIRLSFYCFRTLSPLWIYIKTLLTHRDS